MLDGVQFGEEVVALVKGYVERELAPLKAANLALEQRLAELEGRPVPERGEQGIAGENGLNGVDGKDGADGRDGRGVRDLLIDRDGNLIASMDDGEMKNLGPICGKDGEAGKDGRDGFGFDDMDACVLDDDRTIEFSFRRGDEEKAFTFKWPAMIYRGVYSEGTEYQPGDTVTWGGSLWHCDTETKDKPGTDSWTLAVKKGRDGKNG